MSKEFQNIVGKELKTARENAKRAIFISGVQTSLELEGIEVASEDMQFIVNKNEPRSTNSDSHE